MSGFPSMRTLLSISLLFYSLLGSGQNLVPNPSFEDTLPAPNWNAVLDQACSEWQTPGPWTTDYYHDLNPLCTGCASLLHAAHTGMAYAGIYLYDKRELVREILTVRLLDTLVSGQKYLVEFYVCRGYFPNYTCNNVGAFFSNQPISNCSTIITMSPQVTNPVSNDLSDKVNWVKVSGTLIADGTEIYMTIGNFTPDSASNLGWNGDGYVGDSTAYYYVDDVSVSTYIEPPDTIYSFNIFPNPSGGNFEITGVFPEGTQLNIYNVLGQKISESISIPQGSHRVPISLDLAAGAYIFRLESYGELIERGKFVIQ